MATTYEAIATVTVGSGGAANITFSSIAATYTDLLLKVSARNDRASTSDDFKITINANTGATYSNRRIYGNGVTANSDGGSAANLTYAYSGVITGNSATASTFGNSEFYFPNYTSSNSKSWSTDGVSENNATGAQAALYANLTSDTNAITSIKIESYNGTTFSQYSTATLYGIKNS